MGILQSGVVVFFFSVTEMDILGSPALNSPYGLCGRKATVKKKKKKKKKKKNGEESELRRCVKDEVDVLG